RDQVPGLVAAGGLEKLEHETVRELEDQVTGIVSHSRDLDDTSAKDRLRLRASIDRRGQSESVSVILARQSDASRLDEAPEHGGGDCPDTEDEHPGEFLAMHATAVATDEPGEIDGHLHRQARSCRKNRQEDGVPQRVKAERLTVSQCPCQIESGRIL